MFLSKDIKHLFSIIGEENIRFVGGCVRDFLLGKEINDIDFATSLRPELIKKILKNNGIRTIDTGIKYGTVTIIYNEESYEVTTLRRDIQCYGRKAETEFTDKWQEDASRRDFTVNALYMDINGEIYDYFQGKQDLKKRKIRFIGDPEQRINEDYLRILRFARFYLFYNKNESDLNSFNACKKLSYKIKNLSGERIKDELFKILRYEDSHNLFTILKELNILCNLFQTNLNIDSFKKQNDFLDDPVFKLSLLFSDLSIKNIKENTQILKLSNKEKNEISLITTSYQNLIKNSEDIEYLFKEIIYDHGNNIALKVLQIIQCRDNINQNKLNKLKNINEIFLVKKLPINGNDIIQAGITEGEKIKKILYDCKKAWISSNCLLSKKELINYFDVTR